MRELLERFSRICLNIFEANAPIIRRRRQTFSCLNVGLNKLDAVIEIIDFAARRIAGRLKL